MTRTPGRFAYRCLPLVIANSHGWELLVDRSFAASWSGGSSAQNIQISFLDEEQTPLPASHFGEGVLTFQVGYLFETEERYNLWVTGPINEPKDGIVPLCGVVEADWGPYTFTMNWMFTRPGTVRFDKGEPFCHIFPLPRLLLHAVEPEIRDLSEVPEKSEALASWQSARTSVLGRVRRREIEPTSQVFGMHYFRGETPDGGLQVSDHITRLTLKPFKDRTARQVSRSAEEARQSQVTKPIPAVGAVPASVQAERLVRACFMNNNARDSTVMFPDPFFSAYISCEGDIDEAIRRSVVPFWLRLHRYQEESQCYLWFERKGERLAIHLHGPEEKAIKAQEWLEEVTAGLSPEWYPYRRGDSPLVDGEFLPDHRYASLASVCLAHGCSFVLKSLNCGNIFKPGPRRTTVLRALLAGISTLKMPLEMRFSYLAYHRDSVLRETVPFGRAGESLATVSSSLDIKAETSTAALVRLRSILAKQWNSGAEPLPTPAELGAWQSSLDCLCRHACSSIHSNRWAAEPAFIPMYKACHGIANQVGMAPLDEAFLCHLLVRARPPDA